MNLKVRVKNKVFWLTLVPAILVLLKQIASTIMHKELNIEGLSTELQQIVESVFLVLGILGIVVDPTTAGISDSELAKTYTKPRKSEVQ